MSISGAFVLNQSRQRWISYNDSAVSFIRKKGNQDALKDPFGGTARMRGVERENISNSIKSCVTLYTNCVTHLVY